MTCSFNLVDQPWVPCVAPNGRVDELSLHDALARAHEYRELGGESPLVTASLYRLLLAILHRIYGPEGRDAWRALWERGQWNLPPLEAYLAEWRHRFDLFDAERPFFQGDHPTIPKNRVGDLLHELSKADTFFDHRTDDGVALTPAEAARHLVTAQAFGRWMTKGPYGQLPFGTCARGVVFFAKGSNLFEDLALNLVHYPTQDTWLPCDLDHDAPCWEMDDPFAPDRRVPFGYLDYMTWLSRRILLLPESEQGQVLVRHAKIAPGLRMSDEMRNPAMQHKGRPKKGWKSWVAFREERGLWRDSATILRLPSADSSKQDTSPPVIVEWLATLVDNDVLSASETRRLTGMGMAGDLNQYRVHFYRREELPLPLAYLSDQNNVLHLEQAIGQAEGAGHHLWGALSSLATEVLFHKAAQGLSQQECEQRDNLLTSWGADRHYWAALELPFYELIADLPRNTQPARAAWAAVVRRAAWEALEGVIAGLGEDPASLKAAVIARGQLGGGLHKAFDAGPAASKRNRR